MKRVIAGATGFIGQQLVWRWLNQKHEIIVIGRDSKKITEIFCKHVKPVEWQELKPEHIKDAEVIVNLSGANIGEKRWTETRQQEILTSRTKTTAQLAKICASLGGLSPPLFNASAVGVYGLQKEVKKGLPLPLDETTEINYQQASDFLAKVGRAWELAVMPAINAGVRTVLMRFGVVLGKGGGVLPRLALPVKLFLGGPIGSGQQPFSWIALEDLCDAIEFLLQKTNFTGPINLVASQCVTQKQLVQTLGKILHRPSIIPIPAFMLKLIFGKMVEELLLAGQHVYPKKLLELGFKFKCPTIGSALANIYGKL